MIWRTLLKIPLVFFLQATSFSSGSLSLLTGVLYMFGMWGVFQKCGVKGWWALIPCAREVKLGEITGWEREGRIAAVLRGIMILLLEIDLLVSAAEPEDSLSVLSLISVVVSIALLIYLIRLYRGLIEVFDRRRRWILLWVFLSFLPACLWGWTKKYSPLWKVEEMKNEAAEFFSGSRAEVLDQGLTVNLEERTATDFFKKK